MNLTTQPLMCSTDSIVQIVAIGPADNQQVDVDRRRASFPGDTRGPRAEDCGAVHTWKAVELLGKNLRRSQDYRGEFSQ